MKRCLLLWGPGWLRRAGNPQFVVFKLRVIWYRTARCTLLALADHRKVETAGIVAGFIKYHQASGTLTAVRRLESPMEAFNGGCHGELDKREVVRRRELGPRRVPVLFALDVRIRCRKGL